jgi:hypothetical protein
MKLSKVEAIQKIKKSAAAVRRVENNASEEKQILKQAKAMLATGVKDFYLNLGAALLEGCPSEKLTAELKNNHNKFVRSRGLRLELFPE